MLQFGDRRLFWLACRTAMSSKRIELLRVYGKATYTVNDNFNFGGSEWYSPSVLNTGADGLYYAGNVTFTAPTTWFTNGVGAYVSGDLGYWNLGTSDSFYGRFAGFPNGIPYKSYANWDAGSASPQGVYA